MTDLPHLTESQVRAWTDTRSFSRGQSYARSDAIAHPRIQGMTLKAECWGTAAQPYRVEVTLNDQGIDHSVCSCPVGLGCKHAVALLLTWLDDPDCFREVEDLRTALSRRGSEELVDIILQIIDRYPDAEEIVMQPLPGIDKAGPPLDSRIIRRQVRAVLAHTPHEWGASYAAAAEVDALVRPANVYGAAGDWRNAAVVYGTVADVILEDYDEIYEEEGEFLAIVGECAAGLGGCLAHIDEPDQRQSLLETLFRIWEWDVNFGGAGIGDTAAIAMLNHTTDAEKVTLADWVRAALPAAATDSYTSQWRRGTIGGFLLQLEKDCLDDETYLRICRETGRTHDLVERLLALERVDEATETARQASDFTLLGLTELFQGAGLEQIVAELMRERIASSRDTRLHDWLYDYEMNGHRYQAALEVSYQLLTARLSLENYQKVREPAQQLGIWNSVRETLLDALRQGNEHGLRVQIFLDEGLIDQALEAFAALKRHSPHNAFHMGLTVAQAAEAERPEAAVELYLDVVSGLIQQRDRGSYAAAVQHLARA